ncbi:MAG TPA: hypothetical protein PKE45_17390, partial [Caldilineaceae bacterium]|nr:hypothetical protein [Caldilineaceae bacterium]
IMTSKSVIGSLAIVAILVLLLGLVIPSQAQTVENSLFLPLISSDASQTDEEAGFLVQITSAEQLEQVLLQEGATLEDSQVILQAYQDRQANVGGASQASPMGYSFRPLACFGTGARALFDVGQGFFSANYLIPYPSGISGYCTDSLCTYYHSRSPAQAGIYGHSLSSDGFASHIYAQCL